MKPFIRFVGPVTLQGKCPQADVVHEDIDLEYDFEDVDCEDCGKKFFVRPSLYIGTGKQYPTKCERCRKGLAPLYEY